jgi:lipoprotein-anchoring transpeptidase ErfK/SrfK
MGVAYRSLAASFAAVGLFLLTIPAIVPSASAREVVEFRGEASPGTIVVRTSERRLYYVLGKGQAIRYPVGVGRVGRQWAGRSVIDGKHVRPDWAPPPDIAREHPNMPKLIRGGAPNNPMGVAALTLSGGQYAIHGTNNPNSIGGFVSYGCIRMYNQDIVDLYDRVNVGTPVMVTR